MEFRDTSEFCLLTHNSTRARGGVPSGDDGDAAALAGASNGSQSGSPSFSSSSFSS